MSKETNCFIRAFGHYTVVAGGAGPIAATVDPTTGRTASNGIILPEVVYTGVGVYTFTTLPDETLTIFDAIEIGTQRGPTSTQTIVLAGANGFVVTCLNAAALPAEVDLVTFTLTITRYQPMG
jgi:hypothetical protein